jgi:hypothetical protein
MTPQATAKAPARYEDVAGHYYLQGVMEVGSELVLMSDGKFQYMLAYGAADYFSQGTWRLQDGRVILNAAVIEKPPFRLVKSEARKGPGVRVWVKAPNGQPVPHIRVGLKTDKGMLEAETSNEGAAFFPEAKTAEQAAFEIRVYSFQSDPFALNQKHNEFHFEINGDAIRNVAFKNEPLMVDGKTLVMTFWGADRQMKYVKE